MSFNIDSASSTGESVNNSSDASDGFLIGVSRGNSFFTEEQIEKLIEQASNGVNQVVLMLPDEPSVHTLQAIGYTSEDAQRKSRLDFNAIENRIKRIQKREHEIDIRVLRWSEVEKQDSYNRSYARLQQLYDQDSVFKADVRSETERVVRGAFSRGELRVDSNPLQSTTAIEQVQLQQRIDTGVLFFLQEIALMVDAARITGMERCAYVYHKPMEVVSKLFEGEYSWTPEDNNGYLVYS